MEDDLAKKGPGRPKGSKNRRAQSCREYLEEKSINLIEQTLARIPNIKEPKDQVDALIKLFPYVYPKLTSITVETKTPEQLEVESLSLEELRKHAKTIVLSNEDYAKQNPALEDLAKNTSLEPTSTYRPTTESRMVEIDD